jgi:hypothetical protein
VPITYSYNPQKGFVEVFCEGLISDQELFEARMRYLDETEAARGISELVDLSKADFSLVTPANLQQLAQAAERAYQRNNHDNVRIAFYTTDYLTSVMISLYGDFITDAIEEVRIFKDRDQAEQWLGSDRPVMNSTIDLQKGIVFSRYSGYIRAKELIEHIKTLRKDPEFHGGLNTIADIRYAELPENYTEIMSLVNFIKSSLEERGEFRLALIITRESTSRTAIVYEAMAEENHVRLCYDMAEAEAWVMQRA